MTGAPDARIALKYLATGGGPMAAPDPARLARAEEARAAYLRLEAALSRADREKARELIEEGRRLARMSGYPTAPGDSVNGCTYCRRDSDDCRGCRYSPCATPPVVYGDELHGLPPLPTQKAGPRGPAFLLERCLSLLRWLQEREVAGDLRGRPDLRADLVKGADG